MNLKNRYLLILALLMSASVPVSAMDPEDNDNVQYFEFPDDEGTETVIDGGTPGTNATQPTTPQQPAEPTPAETPQDQPVVPQILSPTDVPAPITPPIQPQIPVTPQGVTPPIVQPHA